MIILPFNWFMNGFYALTLTLLEIAQMLQRTDERLLLEPDADLIYLMFIGFLFT